MSDERTVKQLADETIEGLSDKYELVYIDYQDKLTDEQIAAVVRGDHERLWELTADFEADSRWNTVREIIRDEAQMVLDRWCAEDDESYDHLLDELEYGDDWERIREAMEDRDQSDWLRDLARNSGSVLLRIAIPAIDEDHAYNNEQVSAAEVLGRLGLEASEHNLEIVQDALNNASPEFSVLMGYWIVGASVLDLYDLALDVKKVEIVGPHLYLGNPFSGSGYITEQPLRGTVTVNREDLRTDDDAFGYAVDKVYGGLSASSFEADIRAAG